MDKNKIIRYLNHLDREALNQVILFLIFDPNGKDTILSMATEFAVMYGEPVDEDCFGVED